MKKPRAKVEPGETMVSPGESDVEELMVSWAAAMENLEEKEKKVRNRIRSGLAFVIFILL